MSFLQLCNLNLWKEMNVFRLLLINNYTFYGLVIILTPLRL